MDGILGQVGSRRFVRLSGVYSKKQMKPNTSWFYSNNIFIEIDTKTVCTAYIVNKFDRIKSIFSND